MIYTPGPLPEPACWTLKETLAAKQTTTTGRLWFTNPVNHGWAGLYTAEQLSAHTAAEVARAVAAERERCAKACAGEQLEDEPDTEGDFAYMHAVCDCIAAIRALPIAGW